MDELILAALQDRLTPDDGARLEAWRRASPQNEAHYLAMARLWGMSARVDPLEARVNDAPSLLEIGPRRSERPHARHGVGALRRRNWPRWVAAGAAAALLLLAALLVTRRPNDAGGVLRASEFSTERAEMVTASLDDGSVVRLAPESRLRVEPVTHRREVWLDGEAFFAVAKDSSRPFAVRTRAGSVEVLGTRFDLRVEGDELRLIVTEGKVALTSGRHRRFVVAGQLAHVRNGGEPVVENTVKVDSLLSWTDGFIVFQNTPLRQVAQELERRYDVRVLLPDSALASRTVTAWFTNQDFRQVLFAICSAVDAHCTLRDSVASIEP